MEDSKKHIKNPPLVQKMHDDKLPDLLKTTFPDFKMDSKRFSNGIVGISKSGVFLA
jgi:hypothetical protein